MTLYCEDVKINLGNVTNHAFLTYYMKFCVLFILEWLKKGAVMYPILLIYFEYNLNLLSHIRLLYFVFFSTEN